MFNANDLTEYEIAEIERLRAEYAVDADACNYCAWHKPCTERAMFGRYCDVHFGTL
jgi:hypothetical protein